MAQAKKCTKCELEKGLDEFHKSSTGRLGRQSQCRECKSPAAVERERLAALGMKKCSTCRLTKNFSEFHKHSKDIYGTNSQCKACKGESDREYYEKNRESVSARKRQWNIDNRDHMKKYNANWYRENRDRALEVRRLYSKNNQEKIKAHKRTVPTEKVKEWRRKEYIKNKSRYIEAARRYRARKSGANIGDVPSNALELLIEKYGDICLFPGCTDKNLTIDHVTPLAWGGPHTMGNLQLLCKKHNSSKRDRNDIDYRSL